MEKISGVGKRSCEPTNEMLGPAPTTTYIKVPIGYTSMLVAQSPGS